MTLTFYRYGSTDATDTLELDETKSSIIDKLNEPSRLSAILTSETAPQIALGNYTDYGGTRYYVTKEPTVRKEHSQLYTVEVDLERSLGLARITILANPVDHRTTFDYTGTATEHLQLIVDCLNAKYEEVELKWTRGAVHCKDTVKHIKYDGATVLGALQQIRETYETDIFADGETLSLGQEDDKTTALPLAYGKGKGLLSGLERHKHTDDTVPTRLYVTGTKRNMTKGRLTLEKDVILSVDLKSGAIERVTGGVPTAGGRSYYRTDPTGQYIAEWSSTDKFFQSSRRFPTEATYTNEEIYPSHVSTIKTVTKVKDNFEVNSDFNYTPLRIEGEQMQVVFQTGNLAGRDFDAKYYPSTDRLAIVPKEEDDTTLPSDTLCPKVGDQYIVTGIKLPDEYIREAERNLTDEALRHLVKLQQQRYSYKADIDPVYLHDNHDTIAQQLAVGRYVRLTDPQIAIGDPYVRIVGKRTYLDRPYTPEIELSNEVEPRSELTRVLNELDRQDDGLASIIDRLRQSGVLLSDLTLSSDAMRQRVEAAEEALAGKQPKGNYVDPSQLDASKQQAVAEAVKQAEELDKKLKVGGRNLIRAGYFEKVYFRSDTDKFISYDDKDKKITYIGKASRWNSWVWLSDMEDVTTINLRKAIGEYTLSFSVRGRGTVSFEVVGNYKTNYSDYKTTVQTLTEDWQRVSCPFTRSAEDSSLFCLYNDKPETGDWVQFADDWKLERGTVATDWTPAPEDLDNSISKLTSQLEKHGKTLGSQAEALAGQGERLNTAEKAIEKKLESSTFENFKVGDFKTITDWKSSMEEKVGSFASSAELESLKTLLNNEVSHWTSDTTPAPQSYTATAKVKASKQPWGTNEDPERHVGDLCTVIGADEKDKGVSYRFIKDPSADSYKWLKVIDNDGILALKMHNKFIKTYTERQAAIDTDSKNQQNALDALKKRLGLSDDTLENLKSKVKAQSNTIDEQQHTIDEMRNQYKVTVTTRGSIRNGEIVDGVPRNGYPAILHTAHVYDTAGKEISDTETLNKLVWTVNNGRTTAPLQFVVPGATCYVTEKDLVKSPDNPNYYDIELNSNF